MTDSDVERKCENCGHEYAYVQHEIVELPKILILHLKRFQVNFEIQDYEKLRSQVKTEKEIYLGKKNKLIVLLIVVGKLTFITSQIRFVPPMLRNRNRSIGNRCGEIIKMKKKKRKLLLIQNKTI